MEEYITRAEFEAFKRHMEQKTDEMKALRVDVHNVDVEVIKQELHTVSNTWLETLQEHYSEHTARFDKLEKAIADLPTREDLEALLIRYLQPKPNGH
jgi:hypothetical protein